MLTPDYSKWRRRKAVIDILRLDKKNPRLPVAMRGLNQDKIRDYLVRTEKVDRIAKLIIDEGFIPFEPIYVVKEGDSYTVIEGNRRTCALQLLRDPDKAPAEKQLYYKRLSRGFDPANLEKITVTIAPSRSVLRKLLYLKHADEAQKKWGRQQKHRFIAEAIFEGKTVDDIADELKENVSSVYEAVLEILLQEAFSELDLEPEMLEFALSDKFPLSTATRIVASPAFKGLTKIRIDGALLRADIGENRFKSIIKKIVTDLSTSVDAGGHSSRTLEKASHISKYVESLKGIGAENNEDDIPFAFTPSPGVHAAGTEKGKKAGDRKPQEKLISRGYQYVTGVPKLDALILQGQSLPAGSYNLAAALLLRTILELSVVRIFEIHGQRSYAINKNGRTKQLSEAMKILLGRQDWFDDPQYRIDLERFCDVGNKQYVHLETLNRYAHGPYSIPDRDSLRAIWTTVEPLVAMCCEGSSCE